MKLIQIIKEIHPRLIIIFLAIPTLVALIAFVGVKIKGEIGNEQNGLEKAVLVETEDGFPILVYPSDPIDGKQIIRDLSFRRGVNNVLKKIIKPGDIAIDIGAGYGYQSILLAKLVGTTGKVYSFENLFDVNKLLTYSIYMNGFYGVRIFDQALYAENISLVLERYSFTISKVFADSNKTNLAANQIKVKGTKLDDMLPNLSNVKLINIRSYGDDFDILKGATSLISRSGSISIIVDWNNPELKPLSESQKGLLSSFFKANYDFWLILEDGSLKPLPQEELLNLSKGDILITRLSL